MIWGSIILKFNSFSEARAFLTSHPANFISSGFGLGLITIAPGTIGTLLAFPVYEILLLLVEIIAVLTFLNMLTSKGKDGSFALVKRAQRIRDGMIKQVLFGSQKMEKFMFVPTITEVHAGAILGMSLGWGTI